MLFYEEPLHIVRGERVWLFDDQGKRYLDVYNNVPSIGHCHPRVVQAVAEQMGTLNVHNRYLHEGIHRYAERLLDTLSHTLNRLVMMCTGSESNDMALRLAPASATIVPATLSRRRAQPPATSATTTSTTTSTGSAWSAQMGPSAPPTVVRRKNF